MSQRAMKLGRKADLEEKQASLKTQIKSDHESLVTEMYSIRVGDIGAVNRNTIKHLSDSLLRDLAAYQQMDNEIELIKEDLNIV